MKISVHLVLESSDYGGEEFYEEITKLIADIDTGRGETHLVGFSMYQTGHHPGEDERDYVWYNYVHSYVRDDGVIMPIYERSK